MAKRKITVTVDEELLEMLREADDGNLSALVNTALAEHAERLARLAGLRELLDDWEAVAGPPSAESQADASSAFDEVEGKPVAWAPR